MISQRLANPGGGLESHHVGNSVAYYDLSFDCNPKKFDMLINNWLDDDQGRDEGQDVRVFFLCHGMEKKPCWAAFVAAILFES